MSTKLGGSGNTDQSKIKNFLESINETVRNFKSNNMNNNADANVEANDAAIDSEINNRFTRIKVSDYNYINEVDEDPGRNRSKSILSKSIDNIDDNFLENVLNCKERRASWTHVRSQRNSYIPSLTAICEFYSLNFCFFFSNQIKVYDVKCYCNKFVAK